MRGIKKSGGSLSLMVLVFTLLLTGCMQTRTTSSTVSQQSIPLPGQLPKAPDLEVYYQGEAIDVEDGSSEWNVKVLNGSTTEGIEAGGIYDVAEGIQLPQKVTIGEAISLRFDEKEPDAIVVKAYDGSYGEVGRDVTLGDYNEVIMDLEPGTYVFEVIGSWDQGWCQYVFKVKLIDPEEGVEEEGDQSKEDLNTDALILAICDQDSDVFVAYNPSDKTIELWDGGLACVIDRDVEKDLVINESNASKYHFNLLVKADMILVQKQIGVQKWGDRIRVDCYENKGHSIEPMWTTEGMGDYAPLKILDYEEASKTFHVTIHDQTQSLVITDEEASDLYAYCDELDQAVEAIELVSVLINQSGHYDYDQDGEEEILLGLVVYSYVGLVYDTYFMAYDFTDQGMVLEEAWFASTRPEFDSGLMGW